MYVKRSVAHDGRLTVVANRVAAPQIAATYINHLITTCNSYNMATRALADLSPSVWSTGTASLVQAGVIFD